MASLRPQDLHRVEETDLESVSAWVGWRVDDVVGAEIGRIEEVVADTTGERAEWLVVNEYRFGEGRRFVIPAAQATASDGRVGVPYGREHVRASARIAGACFTPKADRPLREHYLLRERAA